MRRRPDAEGDQEQDDRWASLIQDERMQAALESAWRVSGIVPEPPARSAGNLFRRRTPPGEPPAEPGQRPAPPPVARDREQEAPADGPSPTPKVTAPQQRRPMRQVGQREGFLAPRPGREEAAPERNDVPPRPQPAPAQQRRPGPQSERREEPMAPRPSQEQAAPEREDVPPRPGQEQAAPEREDVPARPQGAPPQRRPVGRRPAAPAPMAHAVRTPVKRRRRFGRIGLALGMVAAVALHAAVFLALSEIDAAALAHDPPAAASSLLGRLSQLMGAPPARAS